MNLNIHNILINNVLCLPVTGINVQWHMCHLPWEAKLIPIFQILISCMDGFHDSSYLLNKKESFIQCYFDICTTYYKIQKQIKQQCEHFIWYLLNSPAKNRACAPGAHSRHIIVLFG